ncbi:hypothetical protein DM02DRAFT_658291 [Periconia macrospinosa]|uniref:Uncharacterized protein n=1 Tax=Periconia macrospinosa TaxID=97972 RepID=A0A2V1DJX8_9PLEO|nr:hypothetical protein DM02DRAFT_658291 [Periconia macrospinosa]
MLEHMLKDNLLDFIHAFEVASDIFNNTQLEDTPLFRHHSSNIRVPFSDLVVRMRDIYGGKFTKVSRSQWLLRAAKPSIEDLILWEEAIWLPLFWASEHSPHREHCGGPQ